jgi:hypothetical protein
VLELEAADELGPADCRGVFAFFLPPKREKRDTILFEVSCFCEQRLQVCVVIVI